MITAALLVAALSYGSLNSSAYACAPCPAPERTTEKVVIADLDGLGHQRRVTFFRCEPRRAIPGQLPAYIFGVSVVPAGKTEPQTEWCADPTSIGAFYLKENRVVVDPVSRVGLIAVSVQYGGRVLSLHTLRYSRRGLTPVGQFAGPKVHLSSFEGRLVASASSPDRTALPQLWVWSDGRFVDAAGQLRRRIYARIGGEYRRSINAKSPTNATWIYFDCVLASKAYLVADEPERALQACMEARNRIMTLRSVTPYFPSESPQQFHREADDAIRGINDAISRLRVQIGGHTVKPAGS